MRLHLAVDLVVHERVHSLPVDGAPRIPVRHQHDAQTPAHHRPPVQQLSSLERCVLRRAWEKHAWRRRVKEEAEAWGRLTRRGRGIIAVGVLVVAVVHLVVPVVVNDAAVAVDVVVADGEDIVGVRGFLVGRIRLGLDVDVAIVVLPLKLLAVGDTLELDQIVARAVGSEEPASVLEEFARRGRSHNLLVRGAVPIGDEDAAR
uniref:Uncharacterized protein n=1 Tax=Strombidinopsis acuminata TaxID=141414 RepID=A0A7S3TE14_9SPIT|mmetsp:Transcript_3411/g.10545  ORF Transcript_3411/g.10545 Transcript_3411/m.10545 type:complete len:203 (+) Transcript_3411:89-697(+)